MNPINEGSNGMNDEVGKALIDKAVDIGRGVNDIREMVRRLPDPTSALQETIKLLKEQAGVADKSHAALGAAVEKIQSGVQTLLLQKGQDNETIDALRKDMFVFREFFSHPLKKEVHYRHILGKPLLVIMPMMILIGILSALLVRSNGRARDHEANDINWRCLKLMVKSEELNRMDSIEDKVRADAASITKSVEEEENRRAELAEKLVQEQKTQADIKELEARKKMH